MERLPLLRFRAVAEPAAPRQVQEADLGSALFERRGRGMARAGAPRLAGIGSAIEAAEGRGSIGGRPTSLAGGPGARRPPEPARAGTTGSSTRRSATRAAIHRGLRRSVGGARSPPPSGARPSSARSRTPSGSTAATTLPPSGSWPTPWLRMSAGGVARTTPGRRPQAGGKADAMSTKVTARRGGDFVRGTPGRRPRTASPRSAGQGPALEIGGGREGDAGLVAGRGPPIRALRAPRPYGSAKGARGGGDGPGRRETQRLPQPDGRVADAARFLLAVRRPLHDPAGEAAWWRTDMDLRHPPRPPWGRPGLGAPSAVAEPVAWVEGPAIRRGPPGVIDPRET